MNRTQRSFLYAIAGWVVFTAICAYAFLSIFVFKNVTRATVVILMLLYVGYLVAGVLVLRRRQSPVEPEADERDRGIMKNAVLVSCFAMCLFLAVATVIAAILVGEDGSVPVYVMTFINFGVVWMAMLVYFAAVLVQYARTGKGEQS